MFESHTFENSAFKNLAVESRPSLYDGAYVRLDIRWHHNPVFVCEKAGDHFRVAGYEYEGDGRPLRPYVPTPFITGVLTDQT